MGETRNNTQGLVEFHRGLCTLVRRFRTLVRRSLSVLCGRICLFSRNCVTRVIDNPLAPEYNKNA